MRAQRAVHNDSLQQFFDSRSIYPRGDLKYRMVEPTLETSMADAGKYDRAEPLLSHEDNIMFEEAFSWMSLHFSEMRNSRSSSTLDAINLANKQSSCGFPWDDAYVNKEKFFNSEAVSVLDFMYDDIITSPNKYVPIYTVHTKHEMRPCSKLDCIPPKHRTFTAAPVEHSVMCNRMCMEMNEKFYELTGFSMVGKSKFQRGWSDLYSRLYTPDAFNYSLDETQYDASLSAYCLRFIHKFRESCLIADTVTELDAAKVRLSWVYDNIINTVLLLETGEFVQKQLGNPSGSSNTVIDNTLALFLLFSFAFIKLARNNKFIYSYDLFLANVKAALFGDDNIYTTTLQWFSAANIAEVWSEIGVITKSEFPTSVPLDQLSFCSQGFGTERASKLKSYGALCLPRPLTETILASLLYASRYDNIIWHYARAAALKIEAYPNEELFNLLSDYLSYLRQHYPYEFSLKSITLQDTYLVRDLIAWNHEDSWYEVLYFGLESSKAVCAQVKEITTVLKNSNNDIESLPKTYLQSNMSAGKDVSAFFGNLGSGILGIDTPSDYSTSILPSDADADNRAYLKKTQQINLDASNARDALRIRDAKRIQPMSDWERNSKKELAAQIERDNNSFSNAQTLNRKRIRSGAGGDLFYRSDVGGSANPIYLDDHISGTLRGSSVADHSSGTLRSSVNPSYVSGTMNSDFNQPRELSNLSENWHPSSKSRNKLQHALVGNVPNKGKKQNAKVAPSKAKAKKAVMKAVRKPPAKAIKTMVKKDVKSTLKMGGVMGGITKFKHTDFLGTIIEGNSLTVPLTTSYLLNAGESTFPFGRRVARNFQRYKILKCTVRFVPISYPGVNAVTAGDINSQGSLTILFNDCPTDDPPTSLTELMNYPNHLKSTSLCTNPNSLRLPVNECGILQNGEEWFYTRPYAIQTDEDARLTDYGRIHIARIAGNTGNISGASNLGYLYLDYEFELAQPMLSGSIGTDQGSSGYRFLSLNTGTAYYVNPQALASNPFSLTFPTTSSFIIPEAGRYIVTYFTQATTSVSASVGLSAGTNCTAVNMFPLTGTNNTSSLVAASAASETLSLCVDVVSNGTQTGGTVTTTGVLTIVGTCSGFLFVTCIPSTFQFGSSNSSKALENLTNKLRDITNKVKMLQIASDEKEQENERLCVAEEEKEYFPLTATASNPAPKQAIQPQVPATATRKGYF